MAEKRDSVVEGPPCERTWSRTFKELDAEAAAILEDEEVKAISGSGEEWWCPNPDCEIVDK